MTVQKADNRGLSDDQMLAFAASENRTVLTMNRKDFIKLHRSTGQHAGIVVCSRDDNWQRQANRIHEAVGKFDSLDDQLIRVNKPG